jgi:hypothetical protein
LPYLSLSTLLTDISKTSLGSKRRLDPVKDPSEITLTYSQSEEEAKNYQEKHTRQQKSKVKKAWSRTPFKTRVQFL